MRVEVRIQHHPARAHLLPELLDRLSPLSVEVVAHRSEPPSPWAGYRQCLRDIPECSHLLVIQDDALPVPNFAAAVEQITAKHPDVPVCLFLGGLPRPDAASAARAMKAGRRYITVNIRSFLPIVAVLWPRHKAVEFREWAEAFPQLPGQREPRSDDAMGGRWKMVNRERVLATVPSIVEHPDLEPSLIGRPARRGQDRGRVAYFLADDALEFDWS